MSSELERLAEAVRNLASRDGAVRPHIARASLDTSRLASSVPGGTPSAAGASTAFQAAGRSLALASQALDAFARDADRFASNLVGGGSPAGAGATGGTPSHHLPEGYTMVTLSEVEDVEVEGYKLDVTPEDLAWGIEALYGVVLPGMSQGRTLDDFRQMDAELGLYGNRSYADTYRGFFNGDECLRFSRGVGGKWHPENGKHLLC